MGKILESTKAQKKHTGLRIFMYAPPKFGKSRWAANIPNHIFANIEDGLKAIPNAVATSKLETYDDFCELIGELSTENHEYQTLIIDTVDWLEVLISRDIVKKMGNPAYKTIEDIPFGKGYPLLVSETRKLITQGLEYLVSEKGMNIICLAHSDRKTINPPVGDSYDYYAPKLYGKKDKNDTTLSAWTEWSDIIGFGYTKIYTKTAGSGFSENKQAVGGEKYLYLSDKNPAFLAGSRYNMPNEIPFTWEAFCEALAQSNNENKGE